MEEDRSYGEATAAKARGTAWRGAGGGREGAQGCKELSRSSVVSGQKECRLERGRESRERTCGSMERRVDTWVLVPEGGEQGAVWRQCDFARRCVAVLWQRCGTVLW